MRIEVVTIGNELLNGDLADTNTRRFAGFLSPFGLRLQRAQTVPDYPDAIAGVFEEVAQRADLVLVSGGLGPTTDDLTIETAARWAERNLVLHEPTLEAIEARFKARQLPMPANNRRQAMVPEGAQVIANAWGTAPCVALTHRDVQFFFYPGVPSELEQLLEISLRPYLASQALAVKYQRKSATVFGLSESKVGELVSQVVGDLPIEVAYRAHFPAIFVHLQAEGGEEVLPLLEEGHARMRQVLGHFWVSDSQDQDVTAVVAKALTQRKERLVVAESCTGGLIAAWCTERSGASSWFSGGYVTYTDDAKMRELGVSESLLREHGAVSAVVAEAMAKGARLRSGVQWSLAVTGFAGPRVADEPVGRVFLALSCDEYTVSFERQFPWDRARVRQAAAYAALDLLRRAVV